MKRINYQTGPAAFLTVFFALFLIYSCQYSGANVIRGDGDLVTQTFQTEYFNNVELTGAFNVVLDHGDQGVIAIETDNNLHELIEVRVEDGTLRISAFGDKALKPTKMDVRITYPALNRIQVSGACKITSPSRVISDNLVFDLSGASDIQLEIEADNLFTQAAGAVNIHFEGNARDHKIDLAGASNIKAEKLITESTSINLSGAGAANVYASAYLQASLSGFGKINYHGNPTETNINKSGFGTIRSAGN